MTRFFRNISAKIPELDRAPVLVFGLAFALRAAFLLQWLRLPYIGSLSADAWANDHWALEILKNGLIGPRAFYQSPFYAYFLAGCYELFGHEPRAALWFQVLLDSFSCVLLLAAARRCFGARAGAFAGLAAALYRPFIFSAALLTKETFVVFGLSLTLLLGLRAAEGRARDHFFCGLAAGWTVLSRSNTALLVPALLFWLFIRRKEAGAGPSARPALALLAGAALAVMPATLHNFAASRDLVPVNYTGGFTFYLGNNPDATGLATYPFGINSDPLLEEAQSTGLAETRSGRALKPSEASSYWFREGLRFIAARPLRFLGLTALKFWFFWNRYEIPDNYDVQFVARHFGTVLGWPLLTFAFLGTFGAAGLFLCRFRKPSGLPLALLLAYLVSILPFIISDRYRLPGAVFLLPLAAAALDRLISAPREVLRLVPPAAPLILLCLLPAPLNTRSDEAAGWGQLAAVYAARGEFEKASDSFGRAAALAPEGVNEAAVDAAASSLKNLGRKEEALALYREWSAVYPASPMLANNQAALLFELGRTKEAIGLLERSLASDPAPGEQYRNLFYSCRKAGLTAKAARYGAAAVAMFPEDAALARDVRALTGRNRGSK